MIMRGATLLSRAAAYLTFLIALTACGGGGGSGAEFFGGGGNDGELVLELTLLDPQGNATNTVTASSPGTLKVRVIDNGANLVVTVNSSVGDVFPASGTALTDDQGVATFQIEAGDVRGAGTINASAQNAQGQDLAGSLNFQVGATGLRLGSFDTSGMFIENQVAIEPQSALAAGGNAELSVVVLDPDGNRVTDSEEVRFNSGCIAAGLATINPENPVLSVNGEASTLYTATGCTGVDDVTASLVGAGAQAFGALNIASPEANAVLFLNANPTLIVLRGTGGQNRSETSNVSFRVVDGNGQPLQGVTVNFSLTTDVGGLLLSTLSALSNGDGEVSVTVQAGDVATALRVLATVDDGSGDPVSTVSDLLTVTTGLPDQDSITLSVSESHVVPQAFTVSGKTRQLTVRMADKFNNPVVDGTAAVFTTEYGAIVGTCFTLDGVCSVEWRSQFPRLPTLTGEAFVKRIDDFDYFCPSHNGSGGPCPDDLGYTRGARSTILVHAIGEESFVDRNGNGIMDEDERFLFDNLTEAFIDNNEDGVFTPADPACQGVPAPADNARCIAGQEEEFVDYNSNNTFDTNDAPALYNGLLCPPEGNGNWCSRELVHVFDSEVVTLSDGPNWDINVVSRLTDNVVSAVSFGINEVRSYDIYIADTYNNPPPAGSSVSLAVSGDCDLLDPTSTDILDLTAPGAFAWGMSVSQPSSFSNEPGVVSITLNPTEGSAITWSYPCNGFDPCAGFSPRPSFCPDP